MSQPSTPPGIDSRVDPRQALDARVTVQFDPREIVALAQNISQQGVYFTTRGSVAVAVRIEGTGRILRGELVRFDNMGDGCVGIAVRFVEAAPELVD